MSRRAFLARRIAARLCCARRRGPWPAIVRRGEGASTDQVNAMASKLEQSRTRPATVTARKLQEAKFFAHGTPPTAIAGFNALIRSRHRSSIRRLDKLSKIVKHCREQQLTMENPRAQRPIRGAD